LTADTRTGSQTALAAVSKACRRVAVTSQGQSVAMYDCLGKASAILAAGS
jgi:hypothetical protein